MKSATWDKITKISHFSYFTTKIKLTYSVDDIFTLEQIVYADYKAENCKTPCTWWKKVNEYVLRMYRTVTRMLIKTRTLIMFNKNNSSFIKILPVYLNIKWRL